MEGSRPTLAKHRLNTQKPFTGGPLPSKKGGYRCTKDRAGAEERQRIEIVGYAANTTQHVWLLTCKARRQVRSDPRLRLVLGDRRAGHIEHQVADRYLTELWRAF